VSAVWAVLVLLALAQQPPASVPPAEPAIRIVSPPDGAYVSGTMQLQAVVEPLAAIKTVAAVNFFADARLVCTIERPPYECEWDAGELVEEHQIRVTATLTSGGRLTDNVRTRKLDHAENVDVDVVQVTATITDTGGRFMGGLPRSAFRVFEDGQAQTITSFVSVNPPLELLAAIDISGSMRGSIDELKAAVKEFLAAVPERHEVTLLAFNDNIIPLTRRTKDPAARVKAVDRLAAWGTTSLYDVILQGVDMLDRATGRKALVVFTDGEDQGSVSTRDDVLRRLEETDATMYMIGQGRGTSERDLQALMQRLARQSGGRAFFPDRVEDLREVFRQIIEDLSNQYLLSYAPLNTKRDGTWRAIMVRVDGGFRVRAREGYRARTRR
jgi:Ca-activated chloride channel family protein